MMVSLGPLASDPPGQLVRHPRQASDHHAQRHPVGQEDPRRAGLSLPSSLPPQHNFTSTYYYCTYYIYLLGFNVEEGTSSRSQRRLTPHHHRLGSHMVQIFFNIFSLVFAKY